MTAIDVDSVDDTVILVVPLDIPEGASATAELTPRQAFDVVTELLTHIEKARTWAAAQRRESP